MSNVDLKKLLSKILQQTTPVGQPTPIGKIDMYAGSSAPSGWLFCRGQEISRTTYAKLFSVIGTTYGGGDGSTTFNVPDLRNRMPIGAGDTYALNASGGNKDAIVPYHNHSVNEITSGVPSNNTTTGSSSDNTGGMSANADHSHSYDKASGQGWNQNHASGTFISYTTNTWPSLLHNSTNTGSKNLAHTHSMKHTHGMQNHTHKVGAHNTNYAGSDGNATNANLPPYRGINFMIYCG